MHFSIGKHASCRDARVGLAPASKRSGALLAWLLLGVGLFPVSLRASLAPPSSEVSVKTALPASANSTQPLSAARNAPWATAAWSLGGAVVLVWAGMLVRSKSQMERRMARRMEAFEHENLERHRVEAELRESQALYRSLMENLPAGIFRKDREGRYSLVNMQFCRMHGREEKDVLGKTVFDLLSPEKAVEAATEDETVLRTGKSLEIEKEDPRADGTSGFVQILKNPAFDMAGRMIGTQGMITDITDRKATQAALDSERDLLRFMLDHSPDCVYFKDLQSRFLKFSQRHAEFFGFKNAGEMAGKTDFDFFDREHASAAFQDEQEIIRTGVPLVGKVEKELSKDGRVTWALTSKMALRNHAGEIIGTFGISKDITAMKEAEAKLDQAHRQLLETSRMAGMAEVATSVLHNVGNVLNSVNVSSSMISDKVRQSKIGNLGKAVALMRGHEADLAGFLKEDAKGKQLLGYLQSLAVHLASEQEAVAREVASLAKNIDHIKEIVAMQQSYSKVAGICEMVAPSDLVEDALRMNGAALDRHQIELTREYSSVPAILVEKHKVLQILVNLMRNAKYACDESSRTEKRLTARVGRNGGDRVNISIIDNGIGIPPENLTRIFNHGFTTRTEGHGFGLHSGALAAKEMGGALTVQSGGTGQGAAFTLELPLQPPQFAPAEAAAPISPASLPVPARNGRPHLVMAGE